MCLPPRLLRAITRFGRTKTGKIHFDNFVQLWLQTLTAVFREDANYEDFLLVVFHAQL
jgi:hypothetical protein